MKNADILKTFLRSFLLQCVWNYERMQNVGFVYSILPSLRKIYSDPDKRKPIVREHLDFFNTHPYVVGVILGMVLMLEEKAVQNQNEADKEKTRKEISNVKINMACPVAALGDTFFWAGWRPLCCLLAMFPILAFDEKVSLTAAWIITAGFLVVYNALHLIIRYKCLQEAYTAGSKVVLFIQSLKAQKSIILVRILSLITVTVIALDYFLAHSYTAVEKLIFLALLFSGLLLYRRGISSTKIFYGFITITIIVSLIGIKP
ncbi:MAG: hypothetical protein A2252_00510 [Elusimicrobia bacterium RIFOXYA2_FULL_39_19]|nr:MAG: hypothetical protein A2252_00510 [Elusimicrobia bacterium RIFOXYA2_FULL_39_19]